jgi:hypothetical protein
MVEHAIADPGALAVALRPRLGPHPVPQGDPRARGLMVEIADPERDGARILADLPELGPLLALVTPDSATICVVAVNESPPSAPDSFYLRPHVDRRYHEGRFAGAPPRATTILFLDFPPAGRGGELVIFPRGAFAGGAPARDGARRVVADAGGFVVAPRPGRACSFDGDLPHAALGYDAPPGGPLRLAAVIARFARP